MGSIVFFGFRDLDLLVLNLAHCSRGGGGGGGSNWGRWGVLCDVRARRGGGIATVTVAFTYRK